MKDLWDEMDLMVSGAGCDCEETRPFLDQLKNLRSLQFLVGLNESYSYVRSQILLQTPVLTVNQVYALAVQEESQLTLSVANLYKEPLTMLAGRGQGFKATRKPSLICDYCGYKGHLKENYYKIIGYPADFKSKKRPQNTGVKGYANVSAGEGGSSDTTSQMQGHFFTKDQYKQLLSLINKQDPDPGECHTLMTGGKCHVAHTGNVQILEELTLRDVLHGLYGGKVLGIGKEHNGLYLLKKKLNKKFPAIVGNIMQVQEDSTLWHIGLGHPSTVAIQHIPLLKNKINAKTQHSCEICALAKQNRLPFQLSSSKTEQIFQLVHIDV
ncbi:uncharacterized protein LOC142167375 [Nicotiana tabacum]|uniref:Uncharacterized protein LOC142167375 n=1 Tax=Nicotiana tabacum TaxID=4097 RepID=A0AC58SF91_TOBAC